MRKEIILMGMLYRHYNGDVYRAIMPVRNEANNQTMWVYKNVETGERWVRPESEFAAKFQPHLPFGTKLKGDDKEFVVIYVGEDYYCLSCNETAEELRLKLLDVKRYYLLNHVVVQTETLDGNTMYQFVLDLKDV